jgi:excisionase family DNA binding protein
MSDQAQLDSASPPAVGNAKRKASSGTVLDDYLTREQLAEELGITTRTLGLWKARGEAPPATRVGARVYFHKDDVSAWLRKQRKAA